MKVIKLYLRYFFTLTNIIIFSLLIIFLSFCYFMSIYDINSNLGYDQVIASYLENSLYYSKIIIIFSVIFIFIKSFNERNEYVINFVLSSGYKKKENYLYLLIANIIISVLFISILFMNFILIGFIFKSYFLINIDMYKSFISLLFLSIYYGLLSFLFMMLFNNQFILLAVFVLSMLSDLVVGNTETVGKIYLFFFPTLNLSTGNLSFNFLFIIFLQLVLFILNGYIYMNRDLRN